MQLVNAGASSRPSACRVCGEVADTDVSYCQLCDGGPVHSLCEDVEWHICPGLAARAQAGPIGQASEDRSRSPVARAGAMVCDWSSERHGEWPAHDAGSSGAAVSCAMPIQASGMAGLRELFDKRCAAPGAPSSTPLSSMEGLPADSSSGPRSAAPTAKPYGRGSVAAVARAEADPDHLEQAMYVYDNEKFAASSRGGAQARLNWWLQRAAGATPPMEPFPVTVAKLRRALALLKLGGYRSAAMYVAAMRIEHVRSGYVWDQTLALEAREGLNSVLRGIGPPQRCPGMDLKALALLPRDPIDQHPQGPAATRDSALVGAWWALRELELGAATRGQLAVTPDAAAGGCGEATLYLPASKNDPAGFGKARTHGCTCGSLEAMCPVAAARRILESDIAATGDAPLFPTPSGGFCTKAGSVAVFQRLAAAVGMKQRVTGHTLRVPGAQAMARAGMDVWQIQLFCRWGSAAVLGYIRDAPLAVSHRFADRVANSLALDEAREAVSGRLMARKPSNSRSDVDCVRDTVDAILETRGLAPDTNLTELLAELRAGLDEMRMDMAVLMTEWDSMNIPMAEEMSTAPFVVLHTGTLHRMDDSGTRTKCGLTWVADQVAFVHTTEDWPLCGLKACALSSSQCT